MLLGPVRFEGFAALGGRMTAPVNAFVFIDDNQYLSRFSVIKGEKLLKTLTEQLHENDKDLAL